MSLKRRHLATAALGCVALGLGWLSIRSGHQRTAAPDVSYILLNGSQINMAQLKGQVLLVNFWSTSCTSCVAEMPRIIQVHNKFHLRGYSTLAVAMNYDPPLQVADFAQMRRLPFGVVIDNTGIIAKRFGDVQQTPTSFLIDKRGQIAARYVGVPNFVALERLVERLLVET